MAHTYNSGSGTVFPNFRATFSPVVLQSDWNGVGSLDQACSGDLIRIQSFVFFEATFAHQQVIWSSLSQNMSHYIMVNATFYCFILKKFQTFRKVVIAQ